MSDEDRNPLVENTEFTPKERSTQPEKIQQPERAHFPSQLKHPISPKENLKVHNRIRITKSLSKKKDKSPLSGVKKFRKLTN